MKKNMIGQIADKHVIETLPFLLGIPGQPKMTQARYDQLTKKANSEIEKVKNLKISEPEKVSEKGKKRINIYFK